MSGFGPYTRRLAGTIRLQGSIDRVFELFSPLGEKHWVPGWDPELLHPEGVSWAAGLIFRTREERGEAIWVVTRLERAAHDVEYHRVEPGRYVARVSVRCSPAGLNQTDAATEYEFIGLSEAGNAEIAAMDDAGYASKMERWATWINGYLEEAGS
jgi:hypothetical protein